MASFAIPLISAIGGSLMGKFFGGPNDQQKTANTGMTGNAQTTGQVGGSLLQRGNENLSTPASYFSSILSGNMGEPTSAFAPDVNRIRQATQAGLQAETNLAPRGGARSSALFAIPSNEESNIQGLYSQARPAAATGLAKIGETQAGLGIGAENSSSESWRALQSQLADQKKVQQEASRGFGSGLYDILKNINFGGGKGAATPPFV